MKKSQGLSDILKLLIISELTIFGGYLITNKGDLAKSFADWLIFNKNIINYILSLINK